MKKQEKWMVIEWLRVQVDPEKREQYVQKDAEIWTTMLSQCPGFLGKEVWISPDNLAEVILIVRWETFEQWQSISVADLDRTEQEFAAAVGASSYKIVESSRFQVRKMV